MDMKRDVIDSENFYQESFKQIIEPLNKIAEKNNEMVLQNIDEVDNKLLNPKFNIF